MTVLVTGHNGFLGRYIMTAVGERSGRVMGVGRPTTEIPSTSFDQLLAEVKPSVVIHCAGPASVPSSFADPHADHAGSVSVLEAVLDRVGDAKLLLVSSAAVYGQPETLPVTEHATPAPISPYGIHRLEGEDLARCRAEHLAVARVFSAYGEGLRRQVLWDVASQALDGRSIELDGTGAESRDFIHARDVAAALAVIVDKAPFDGETFNVGTGSETTIARLASLITKELEAPPARFTGVLRIGDPARWQADITRLRQLGFAPSVSIEDGARAYARWVRERE
jgi:UDP-glucose 4-epimerase